ncbi:helicase-like transcription factor CHR28 [Sorghum bicolor]|uniref:helicase-like transcription factor CHR28 n=1 Tax=Sorghum bicolor TaxID=4558 RepID=UPI000B425FFD|nr:helicase-like transcription factor CHR28 [Sorghum bicolor]|eukprot:XP_021319327.1 helicase-like transcription factor CHR28 [Sorghum bicolor]
MDKKEFKAHASRPRAVKKKRLRSTASSLRPTSSPAAGTLVVCPASVLKQWANELSTKVTRSAELSVLVYHGGSRTRYPTELAEYDVVVTTYAIVAREVPKENPNDEVSPGNKRKLKKNTKGKAKKINKPGPLAKVRWFRVVLDEAHMIKGHQTQTAKGCCGLNAERRWCLSGTPMQNNIVDLYSYFRFLKYEPYSKFRSFSSMLKDPISRDTSLGYKKLQTVLRIVLLRRTKETLLDGEPIIKIPPKTIQLSKIDFTKEERAFYLRLEENSRQTLKGRSEDFIQKNYVHIFALLSQLRQACNHPFLLRGKESCAHSLRLAKQLPVVTAVNLLKVLESGAAKCTICGVSKQFIQNLCMQFFNPPKDTVAPPCAHVFCSKCVHLELLENKRIIEKVCPASPHCGREISAENLLFTDVLKFCLWPNLESEAPASHSIDVHQPFSVCESSYISSKIRNTIDILNSIINTGDADDTMGSVPSESTTPAKAIVFTQWTGMLDLLECSLASNHIEFRRLDGSMPLNVREKAVKEFNTDPEVRVIIMSLKAGNLGLNMVAACHVLMLDPWWNPSAEDQAVDRAHRIGQTRPVTVSRLTVKDTVEDRILSLQEGKRKMIESALGEDPSGGSPATRLTVEDLKYLFKM